MENTIDKGQSSSLFSKELEIRKQFNIMSVQHQYLKPINILIIDDYKPDVRLVKEILKDAKILLTINSVEDGVEALDYLNKKSPYENVETPDLILLDLNMPRKTGHEVLQEMKEDENLKHIPVIVMTISKSDEDVLKSYNLYANAYIVKPIAYNLFIKAVKSIENFWFTIVRLPPRI